MTTPFVPPHALHSGRYIVEPAERPLRQALVHAWDTQQQTRVLMRCHTVPSDLDASLQRLLSRQLCERTGHGRIAEGNLIVRPSDAFLEEGHLWTVTRCGSMQTLGELLGGGNHLCGLRAATVAVNLIACLEGAHAAELFHGGLDQWCVLIDSDDRVRLTDFGVSSTLRAVCSGATTGASTVPGFAESPEQAENADIHDLGTTLMALARATQQRERGAGHHCTHVDTRALRSLQLTAAGLTRVSISERLPLSVARKALERVVADGRMKDEASGPAEAGPSDTAPPAAEQTADAHANLLHISAVLALLALVAAAAAAMLL
ncbi:hypothetical protein ACFC5X_19465 [Streptomyces sp. NPDC055952]|uniref:hypothetical protein n=1 Tax=Streptomyces sp. NPDC055952 TaxID=3345663 RepID=UPI0035D53A0A